jgi:hypothetical protein
VPLPWVSTTVEDVPEVQPMESPPEYTHILTLLT